MGGTNSTVDVEPLSYLDGIHRANSCTAIDRFSGDVEKNSNKSHHRVSDVPLCLNGVISFWSQYHCGTINFPETRTGQFSAHNSTIQVACIGFGTNKKQVFLDDIWVLDLRTLVWRRLTLSGDKMCPRTGSRGAMIDNYLYIFGGIDEHSHHINDIHCVDITTGESRRLVTTGDIPSARTQPFFAAYQHHLYVWAGYDGTWPTSLYELDLDTLVWKSFPQKSFIGRIGVAYSQVGKHLFCYGSADTGGIIVLNMEKHTFEQAKTSGSEPSSGVIHSAMVHVDNYLFLVGGKAPANYQYIYICDLRTHEWSILDIMPDNDTTTIRDGFYNTDTSRFMIPRTESMAVVYSRKRREILSFLGEPMVDPPAIEIINISEELSFLHLSNDMLDTLQFPQVSKNE